MPELTKEMMEFAKRNSKDKNINDTNNNKIFFSIAAHSFGGILSREVCKRLFSVSTTLPTTTTVEYSTAASFYKPLSFVSVATPHCGVTCIDWAILRWGGWLLGKIYSSTYSELFLDSPLLETMATDKSYLQGFTAFPHHLFVGAHSHDYLVRFETASLLPIKWIEPADKYPRWIIKSEQEKQTTTSTKVLQRSTHVGEPISLVGGEQPLSFLGEPISFEKENDKQSSSSFSQLSICEKSQKIARELREKLLESKKKSVADENKNANNRPSLKVLPVFIPPENQSFCIAHDALMRKGLSKAALPDVVDAVADEMVNAFLREQ